MKKQTIKDFREFAEVCFISTDKEFFCHWAGGELIDQPKELIEMVYITSRKGAILIPDDNGGYSIFAETDEYNTYKSWLFLLEAERLEQGM